MNLTALTGQPKKPSKFEFSKGEAISMTPLGGTKTTTPSVISDKSKLNLSSLTDPVADYFEPTGETRIRDVAREGLPSAHEVNVKILKFGKDVAQGISRNIASMGVTLAKKVGGEEDVIVPTYLQWLFKDEPIKSVEKRIV